MRKPDSNVQIKDGRFEEIDILKGIAIILMVAAHCGAPFTSFAFLFHMAAFFMASGFCYREKTSDTVQSVGRTVIRKIKSLWVPFFCWNTVFVLLRNWLIQINIYTDNPAIEQFGGHITEAYTTMDMLRRIGAGALFSYKEEIIGAMWFLKILFLLTIFFCLMDFLVKKAFRGKQKPRLLIHLLLSMLFLGFGYWGSVHDQQFYGIFYVASYYILFFLGYCLSLGREKYKDWRWPVWVAILILSWGALKLLQPHGSMGLNQNKYGTPFFLLAASLSGWCFLYSLSVLTGMIPKVRTILAFIGQHTLPVVIFHFLAFKIVTAVVVAVEHYPAFCLASFPSLNGGQGWWIFYTIVGISVPIFLDMMYHAAKKKIFRGLNG